tara:strand:+ start:2163 stop:2483 length:321 start_codon:yes stop_codon:yes gene_type:complete
MKKSALQPMLVAALLPLFALTSCKDDILECDDKATIWIINNTVCTPDVEINGDLFVGDMSILDSASYQADAGSYDIVAKMAFISACEDSEETIETDCGQVYRFEIN